MKRSREQPPVPPERTATLRRQIVEFLGRGPVSIGELSREIGLSEKRLHEELAGLRKQVRLAIVPARCGKCGFEFKERRRTKKPGKCPACRSTYIHEPRYSLAGGGPGSRGE